MTKLETGLFLLRARQKYNSFCLHAFVYILFMCLWLQSSEPENVILILKTKIIG